MRRNQMLVYVRMWMSLKNVLFLPCVVTRACNSIPALRTEAEESGTQSQSYHIVRPCLKGAKKLGSERQFSR